MQLRIQMHSDGKDAYKRMWWFSLSNPSATPEEIIDRPILATVSTGSPNEARMQQLLSSFIKNNPNHPVVISLTTMAQKQSTTEDNLPAELLSRSMKELVNHHLRQLSEQNKADSVADILFNGEIFGKAATTKVARHIARGVNSHDFSAVALLQTIDCHVGALNDTGVSQYANIGNPSRGLSLLPKRHHLSHLRSFCDRYIAELLKVKHEQSTAYGEYIHCDYERQLRFLIEQYGLTDTAASTGVQIAITGDGAAMCTSSRKAGQTCLGIKMIDPRCRDPITSQLCFVSTTTNEDEIEVLTYSNVQSADHCFPSAIVSAPESRGLVTHHLRDFFDFYKNLRLYGLPRNGEEPAFKPFDVVTPADLSFQQKITGLGGGCKVSRFFCICCESNSLINHNLFHKTTDRSEFCEFCVANRSHSCCHRPVNDAEELKKKEEWVLTELLRDSRERATDDSLTLRDCLPDGDCKCFAGFEIRNKKRQKKYEMINLKDSINEHGHPTRHIFDYIQHIYHSVESVSHTPLVVYDPCSAERDYDPANIDYVVSENTQLNTVFKTNLLRELTRRRLTFDPTATIEDLRAILRAQLLLRYKIERHKDALYCSLVAKYNDAVVGPDQTASCVLHFHQRTIEKIVSELLTRGLNELDGLVHINAFLDRVQSVVNRRIFGREELHEEDTTGWKVPMKPDGKQLGEITMDDSTCKLFDTGMDYLIDAAIGSHSLGPQYVADWKECMAGYRQVRALLNSRKEFDYDDVCAFVSTTDAFMERYVALTGRDGMTNYFHMLRDGHFAYYLKKYKNLYRLSQQGWENVNSVMKRSFHRGTQRGGGRRRQGKIKPVFYRVMRASKWRMGHLGGMLKHFGHKTSPTFEWGNFYKLPKFSNVSTEDIEEYASCVLKFGSSEVIDEIVDDIDIDLEIAEANA